MRVRNRPPPPPMPQTQEAPKLNGPAGLGARQSDIINRLRRLQSGALGGTTKGKRTSKGRGINDAECVTEFDEAMDEAYDKILGRHKRHHGGQQETEGQGDESGQEKDKEDAQMLLDLRRMTRIYRP